MLKDRYEAGRKLGDSLSQYSKSDGVVLAIPRGGVVIGHEIAKMLDLELDLIIPRKIGAPSQPELAVGAVTEDGSIQLNQNIVKSLGIDEEYIKQESQRQIAEIKRRSSIYRGSERKTFELLRGRTVIITDDGLATGATMIAAIMSVRKYQPSRIIVAVPVSPPQTLIELDRLVDDVICLERPEWMSAIGEFYEDFEQVGDDVVIELLKRKERVEES